MLKGKVNTPHPDYTKLSPDWQQVRDAIEGETTVKDSGEAYLPKPSGFNAQPDGGTAMYEAYQKRAKFPEIMEPTQRGLTGVIHRIPAEITLPEALEPMREKATVDGLSLDAMHERITMELFATGRYGILVDAPSDGEAEVPYLAGYPSESILNWSSNGDFFVLDESGLVREGFDWKDGESYRVLKLWDPEEDGGDEEDDKPSDDEETVEGELKPSQVPEGAYVQLLYEGDNAEPTIIGPTIRGGKLMEEVPFTVVGSTDVSPDVDKIPLLGVVRAAFQMYRLDADYKWQLFMSGQETLFVFSNGDKEITTVGAGVSIKMPADEGAHAEYVGPNCKGIEAHLKAIEREKTDAVQAGARMFDSEKKSAESGEALSIRWSAQTATLTTIALNSAKGLERSLKNAARMVGANPDDVSVVPNLQFIDTTLSAEEVNAIVKAWMAGAMSFETMYERFQAGGVSSQDRDVDEERELISREAPDVPDDTGTGTGTKDEPPLDDTGGDE